MPLRRSTRLTVAAFTAAAAAPRRAPTAAPLSSSARPPRSTPARPPPTPGTPPSSPDADRDRALVDKAAATAKAAAAKAASRAFQRAVTPEGALKAAGDTAESPPVAKATGYVKGQTIGRWKGALRDPLLVRAFSGFGVLLPAAGLLFSARNVAAEARRAWAEAGAGRRTAAAAFATAAALDGALTWTVATGLAGAVRERVPLAAPGGDVAHYAAWYWQQFLGLDQSVAPTLTLLATAAAIGGELYARHASLRDAAVATAPAAVATVERAAAPALRRGDVAGAAAAAATAASVAVDEALPDLLAEREPPVKRDQVRCIMLRSAHAKGQPRHKRHEPPTHWHPARPHPTALHRSAPRARRWGSA